MAYASPASPPVMDISPTVPVARMVGAISAKRVSMGAIPVCVITDARMWMARPQDTIALSALAPSLVVRNSSDLMR